MVIDIILIAIITAMVIWGKYKGMMKCIISILSIMVSLVLAIVLYKVIGDFIINNTGINDNIRNKIVANIAIDDVNIKSDNKLPDTFNKYIDKANDGINDTKNTMLNGVADNISKGIIYGLSYILVFVIIKILTIVLTILAKIVEKLPVFKQFNDLGGAICGFIRGLITIYILISVISIVSPIIKNSFITDQIQSSYLAKYIYNENIFIKIFNK